MQLSALSLAEGWLVEQRSLWEGRLDRMETYVATLQSKGEEAWQETQEIMAISIFRWNAQSTRRGR